MLGKASCGKTSLLVRFVDNDFSCQMPSIGVDMKSVAVSVNQNEALRLQIWDTSGQETFFSLIQ
jgi:GTPase SAR1 family protein